MAVALKQSFHFNVLPNSEQALKLFIGTSCSKSSYAVYIYGRVSTVLGRMPVMSALHTRDSKCGDVGLQRGAGANVVLEGEGPGKHLEI